MDEQFPIGMRVLAVDDDPICLKLLDTLLTKCQYHVLSGDDDPKMVMKGISNGACDYLLKPIRIEELKNIWQHVVRKNKIVSMELNKTSNQDMHNSAICNIVESETTGDSDRNGKWSRKRNGRAEDEDDGDSDDESSDDNEDSSARKKAQVVWSVELHRKFVSAVNQLGIDKAVPKKILDLMNVENLTRENVASHLQKYRLYLKRISCTENGQANMVAALGSADPSYLRLFSMSHVGHFQTLSTSGQFHNNSAAVRSFPTTAMIGRLNTPTSLSGTDQLGHAQNLNNNTNNDQLKFHSAFGRSYQNGVQGIPTSVSLVQIPKVSISSAPSPIFDISNNSLVLEANPLQDTQEKSEFPFSTMDNGSCSDIWSSDVHSSRPSSYPQSECFRQAPTDNITPSITSLLNQCPDSLTNVHDQNNDISFQWWDDHNMDAATYHSNVIGSSLNSSIPMNGAMDSHSHNSTNSALNRNLDFNFYDPLQMTQLKCQNTCIPSNLGSLEDLVIEMMKKKEVNVKVLEGDLICDNNYNGGTSM